MTHCINQNIYTIIVLPAFTPRSVKITWGSVINHQERKQDKTMAMKRYGQMRHLFDSPDLDPILKIRL